MSQEIIGLGGNKGSGKNTAAKVLIERHGFKEVSLAFPLKKLVGEVFDIPMENMEDPVLKETPFEEPITITPNHIYQIQEKCSWLINLDMFKKTKSAILERMIYNSVKRDTKNTMIPRNVIKSLSNNDGAINNVPSQLTFKSFTTPRQVLQFVGTELIREGISPYFWCKVLDESIKNDAKVVITDVRFYEEREYVKVKRGDLIKIERLSDTPKTDGHASENSLGGDSEYNFIIRNNGSVEELQKRLDTLYNYSKMVRNDQIYVLPKES